MTIDAADIDAQSAWSRRTFGPGQRTAGVVAHIRKELDEVTAKPDDITEWIDLLILVLDGATRRGFTAAEIITAYHAKMVENHLRTWPDWRDFSEDEPIEHVRTAQ